MSQPHVSRNFSNTRVYPLAELLTTELRFDMTLFSQSLKLHLP